MGLKEDLISYVREDLRIPLIGIAPADDFSQDDIDRISYVTKTFAEGTPLSGGMNEVLQPRDFVPEAKSVIVAGVPSFMGETASFEACKEELLGKGEPSHVNVRLLQQNSEQGSSICEFLTKRGHQCFSVVGGQFPIKLMASKCGVGFYGKNCVIQHPDYGSWISLMAFVTDAELPFDDPITGECGKCDLCLKACPTGAIFKPYRCDIARCIDFHLGHNKKNIPHFIREKSGNLLGEGCTECRDACPKNKNLKQIDSSDTPQSLLYPLLLEILDISDDEWENGFATTLMGFFLMDKRYLKRNAAIALGNFQDERSVEPLGRLLQNGEYEVRGYAAWALGRIGGMKAVDILRASLTEENDEVKKEIETALAAAL